MYDPPLDIDAAGWHLCGNGGCGGIHRVQMRTGSRGGSMTEGMRQWILETNTVFQG